MKYIIPENFKGKYNKKNGCWLWKTAGAHGYGCVRTDLYFPYPTQPGTVMYVANNGAIPKSFSVVRTCGKRNCVHHKYLKAMKRSDAHIYTRNIRGTNGRKLNKIDVNTIRHLLSMEELSDAEIARMFGVKQSTIIHIKTRYTWRHVSEV